MKKSLLTLALLAGLTGVVKAGPVGPPSGPPFVPDNVILNSTATQTNKTFNVPRGTISDFTASTVTASRITIGGVPVSTSVTSGTSVYPATGTIIAPHGISATTATFTGIVNGTTVTFTGIINGAVIHGSSLVITGTITGSNVTGTNTGDLTLGTTNGLSLSGQSLSLQTANTSRAGALSSTDWNTFNTKLSTTGNGSGLTGLTKTQVGLSNVQDVDQTDAANVTSGLFDPARLATGTASSQRYLRGDQFWAILNSTAVGLGNVTNDKQVKVADYTQKGAILVGIGTGTFSVLAPNVNGYFLRLNSSKPEGVEWIPLSSATFSGGITATTGTFTTSVTSPLALFNVTNSTTGNFTAVNASTVTVSSLTISGLSGVLKQTGNVVLGSASTTDVPEGTNLYYTTARSTGSITASAPILSSNGVISIDKSSATLLGPSPTTSAIPEGSNLYFTTARSTSSISGTYPISNTNGSIGIATASASNVGALSAVDWSTFNNKLSTTLADSTYLTKSSATATYFPKTGGTVSNITIQSGTISVSSATVSSETVTNLKWANDSYTQSYHLFANIEDYGGIPGDATNDDTALTNAMNANKFIYAPVGTYLFASTHTCYDQWIRGDGKGATIFKRASGTADLFIATGPCHLEGITLDGNNLAAPVLVSSGSQFAVYEKLNLKNVASPAYALDFLKGDNEQITLDNCEFHNNPKGHIQLDSVYYSQFYKTRMFGNNSDCAMNFKTDGATDIDFIDTYMEGNICMSVTSIRDIWMKGVRVRLNQNNGQAWWTSVFNPGSEVGQIHLEDVSIFRALDMSTVPVFNTNTYQMQLQNVHVYDQDSSNWPVFNDQGTNNLRLMDFTVESTNPWIFYSTGGSYGCNTTLDSVNYTQGVRGLVVLSNTNCVPGGLGLSSYQSVSHSNLDFAVSTQSAKGGFSFDNIQGNIDLTNSSDGANRIFNSSGTVTDPNKTVIGSIISTVSANVPAINANFVDVGSFTLPTGIWDLSGTLSFDKNTGVFTDVNYRIGLGGTTAGNSSAGLTDGVNYLLDLAITTSTWSQHGMSVPSYRVNINTPTTYYLKAFLGSFASGTPLISGKMQAIRSDKQQP